MRIPAVHEYGPYTLYDLDALPEDGKGYELADEILKAAAEQVGTDVQKVGEYAKARIPLYWIIELDPDPKVTALSLGEDAYKLAAEVRAGHVLAVQEPFPVSLDPVALTETG